ncbi:MAG: DUF5938 domain-containing protein [Kofleriaceae bacterium]
MSKKPVIVYGASGYTGRLVCEYLRELGIGFTAAGRDKARTQAVLDKVPGIETADYDVVEVKHSLAALTELFRGSQVVCNLAGPFIKFGFEVVEACAAAGCHYIDATGEQDWVLAARDKFGKEMAKKELLLSPGVAQMYVTGEIAAQICLEQPGLDTLDILVLWKGFPTQASTQTIFTILAADWFYLEHDKLVKWDPKAKAEVVIPGQHETGVVVPWGGTSHPIWFQNDPRVHSVKAMGGVMNRQIMQGVEAVVNLVEEKIKPLPKDQWQPELDKIAATQIGQMPPRERTRVNTSVDSVFASGPLGRAHCVIHGNSNYKQTGLLEAYAAYSLLKQPPKRVGFASACQAFGHRELLGILRSFGLVLDPIVTRHT